MDDEQDPVLIFLGDMGIQASIVASDGPEKLIAIPTEQFKLFRQWVETWFTLVSQDEDTCYLHERLRGTGETL